MVIFEEQLWMKSNLWFFFSLWVLLLVLSFSNLCLTQDHKDFLLGFVLEVLCLGPWSSLREFLFMVWEVAEFLLSVCPAGRRPSFLLPDGHPIQLFSIICWTQCLFPIELPLYHCWKTIDYMCGSIPGFYFVPSNWCLFFCQWHTAFISVTLIIDNFPFHFVLILYCSCPFSKTP